MSSAVNRSRTSSAVLSYVTSSERDLSLWMFKFPMILFVYIDSDLIKTKTNSRSRLIFHQGPVGGGIKDNNSSFYDLLENGIWTMMTVLVGLSWLFYRNRIN